MTGYLLAGVFFGTVSAGDGEEFVSFYYSDGEWRQEQPVMFKGRAVRTGMQIPLGAQGAGRGREARAGDRPAGEAAGVDRSQLPQAERMSRCPDCDGSGKVLVPTDYTITGVGGVAPQSPLIHCPRCRGGTGEAGGSEAMAEKTLNNSTVKKAQGQVPDLEVFGDGDAWKLLCKASSKKEGWMKSTKTMEIPGWGCLVQVTTQQLQRDVGGHVLANAVAEAVTFVGSVTIVETKDEEGSVIGRSLARGHLS